MSVSAAATHHERGDESQVPSKLVFRYSQLSRTLQVPLGVTAWDWIACQLFPWHEVAWNWRECSADG